MRLWSLHPKYLDSKGLVALWREALLAKKVLEGKTKGYKFHPQIKRFKNSKKPLSCINQYLAEVYKEAILRSYKFDKNKINWNFSRSKLKVTNGQIEFERNHLLNKLKKRDKIFYKKLMKENKLIIHPLFKTVKGKIENWEKQS